MKIEKNTHWVTSNKQRVYTIDTAGSKGVLVVVKRKGRAKAGKVARKIAARNRVMGH